MQRNDTSAWPPLPYDAWHETYATLHLWLQIVGKIALAQSVWVNHSWHVALLVTARGIGTRLIGRGADSFQIDFDFIDHQLIIHLINGKTIRLPLEPQSTARFYERTMSALRQAGLNISIRTQPCEIPDAIAFDVDEIHHAYDPEYANRYWRILAQASRVFEEFRARFNGKCSPVHYFWGSADLAVTRFSGRTAPPHPGGIPNLPDWVAREAYSHEVSSAGFWAGNQQCPSALFYSYAYPEPPGFRDAAVSPSTAHFDSKLQEFVLPYEDMRTADSPEQALLEFLQSTYEAAADRGAWTRDALEHPAHVP